MIFYRSVTTPTAITFDLDDTLYDNHPTIFRAEALLKEKMTDRFPKAASIPRAELNAIKRRFIQDSPELASDMSKLRLLTLNYILADEAKDNVEEAATEMYEFFYNERSKVPISNEVLTTLKNLSKKVPLVGITNGNLDTEQAGLNPYFKTILHASSSRPAKPHRCMFDEAAQYLSIAPKKILHVGDSLINDVFGAYQAGFQSAWFACNRPMLLSKEKTLVLPDVQLSKLDDLFSLLR